MNAAPQSRPIYVARFVSADGDDVRKIRWFLKTALRRFRLRCLSIEIETTCNGGSGLRGIEAFDRDEKSIGVFDTPIEAAVAVERSAAPNAIGGSS
jgi:hypothetical protein